MSQDFSQSIKTPGGEVTVGILRGGLLFVELRPTEGWSHVFTIPYDKVAEFAHAVSNAAQLLIAEQESRADTAEIQVTER